MKFAHLRPLIFLIFALGSSFAAGASGWGYGPHKPRVPGADRNPILHMQLDGQRRGIVIREAAGTGVIVDFIRADGSVKRSIRLKGNFQAVQVNSTFDMARCFLKSQEEGRSQQTAWMLASKGSAWPLEQAGTRQIPLDATEDGRQLILVNSNGATRLEMRASSGEVIESMALASSFHPEEDDNGALFESFSLLRDGTGFLQVQRSAPGEGLLIARFWNGSSTRISVPGEIRQLKGFDMGRIYILTTDGRLWVAASGGTPTPVNLHGQKVRALQWAADGTIQIRHGTDQFMALTRLAHTGAVVSQWVKPRVRPVSGTNHSPLAGAVNRLAESGVLLSQAFWHEGGLTTYLSDPYQHSAAIVLAFEGDRNFTLRAYPWPDRATYSPDLKWMLVAEPDGTYSTVASQPLPDGKALAILDRLAPAAD